MNTSESGSMDLLLLGAGAGDGAADVCVQGGGVTLRRYHQAAQARESCRPSAPSAARSVPSALGALVCTTIERE